MDGTAAISDNLEALKRVLAGLVAMAGLAGALTSNTPTRRSGDRRPPHKGEVKLTLPRHFRLAILRLLRPAEAAARRLIIAAARGLVVTLPPPRKRETKPATAEPFLRRFGIAVVVSPADLARAAAILPRSRGTGEAGGGGGPHPMPLPLFDPPRRLLSLSKGPGRRYVPRHAAPRIWTPGAEPHRLPPPPSPDDPVDATRLALRFAALAAALDDLPGQARRFARWKARNDALILPCEAGEVSRRDGGGAADAKKSFTTCQFQRTSPLRSGRPPGGRLSRFDPFARRSRNIREVDEILAHAHALALYALQYPDTS